MEVMTTDDKFRGLRNDGNEPAGQRQRLPWHAPQLIKEASVQRLTGSHAKSSGGDYHPFSSSVS
jgi:hypothetical protein